VARAVAGEKGYFSKWRPRVRQRCHYKPQHKLAKSTSERAAEGPPKEVDSNLARLKEILEGILIKRHSVQDTGA
jgi:hypothetical protein